LKAAYEENIKLRRKAKYVELKSYIKLITKQPKY